jgi:radical SAM protein with 4Fe4S-binding SPASM domain
MRTPPPFLVSYRITTKCNLRCKHCFSEAKEERDPDELSTSEAFKLIDDLAGWGIKLLILSGGEPLCREDFFEIAEYASKGGIKVGIGSNGTLIDELTARRMREIGIKTVGISIDGADAEMHDSLRGEGSFSRALAGASACKGEGIPFQFNMVIRKDVVPQIGDMLRLAKEEGASAIEFFDLVEVGRAKREYRGKMLSPSERREVMEWLAQAQVDYPILIRVVACPMYPLILQERKVEPKYLPAEMLHRVPYYGRGCAAGMPYGYITIKPNGEVNPCMLLHLNVGNVRERSIIRIWEESPQLRQLRSRDLRGECGRCRYSSICGGCRGRAYEEKGDMLASDPGCWMV